MIWQFLVIVFLVGVLSRAGLKGARQFHILDKPGPDVPQRSRVPTIQGISMLLAVILSVLIFRPQDFLPGGSQPFLGMWLGVLLIAGVTFVDELGRIVHKRFRISALVRLIVQASASLLALGVSGVAIDSFLLPGGVLLEFGPLSTFVFTIGWFLLFINAINRFDGIYGLASGVSSIGFLSIRALISLVVMQVYTDMSPEKFALLSAVERYAMLFFVVAGAAMIIEFRPWGLMRDVGTMVFGFVLGYLSLLGGAKIGTMIVVLMLPLFDAIRVIIDRLHRRKTNPFKGDFTHLHYRLLALGRNRTEARVTIRATTLIMMVLMLLQGDDRIGKILIFLLAACIFFGLNRYLFRKKGLSSSYDRKKQQTKTL